MIKTQVEISLLFQSHMDRNIVRNVGFDFLNQLFSVNFSSFSMLLLDKLF